MMLQIFWMMNGFKMQLIVWIKKIVSNDIFDDFDFINDLHDSKEEESIFIKHHNYIYDSEQSKEEKITAYEQLDKDNYYLMRLRNDVPFYLNTVSKSEYDINDFAAVVEIGDTTMLSFSSPQNDFDEYYVDFMMTTDKTRNSICKMIAINLYLTRLTIKVNQTLMFIMMMMRLLIIDLSYTNFYFKQVISQ